MNEFYDSIKSSTIHSHTHPLASGVTQVVELDGVIGELAKRHFGFVENDCMKVLYFPSIGLS